MNRKIFKTVWWFFAILGVFSLFALLLRIGVAIDEVENWRTEWYQQLNQLAEAANKVTFYYLVCYYITNNHINKE